MTGRQNEAKYVNEYMFLNFGTNFYWTRVHLGALPIKTLAKAYEVKQHWADAIAIKNDTVYIIEAKLTNESAGIGQLELYERLFRQTPKFREAWGLPIKLILLVVRDIPELRRMAEDKGIKYEVFRPAWVVEYLTRR